MPRATANFSDTSAASTYPWNCTTPLLVISRPTPPRLIARTYWNPIARRMAPDWGTLPFMAQPSSPCRSINAACDPLGARWCLATVLRTALHHFMGCWHLCPTLCDRSRPTTQDENPNRVNSTQNIQQTSCVMLIRSGDQDNCPGQETNQCQRQTRKNNTRKPRIERWNH